jgi:hypothetical protein
MARSWISLCGVSTMSESSQRTQEVEGPNVVKRREFRALDMAALRAFWFSILCLSASVCVTRAGSKSCRSMMMLANRLFSGPSCVLEICSCRAAVAALPSRFLGMMKARVMSSCG